MNTEQNKQLVGRLFSDVINRGNIDVVYDIVGKDFVNHGFPGAGTGPQGFKEVVQGFTSSFPDLKVVPEHLIAEGDMVATRGHCTGTHNGTFNGVPATGKSVRIDYVDVWRVKDGQLVENWVQMDMIGVMMQIGAIPMPSEAGMAV